jgi:uncharacterized protein (DUF2141 family)
MLAACSDAREVEVTGEISAAQGVAGPVSLEFFEQEKGVEDAERVSIKKVELAELGAFAETIEISEDLLIVVALQDANGDGLCTDGELWAEVQQEAADDGTFLPLSIVLAATACPAAP